LRNKEVFLSVDETMIGISDVGVGGVNIGERVSKIVEDILTFLIILPVYREIIFFLGGGSGSGGVRVIFEGCLQNDG
jgi:uncharacterized membrane protein (DUF373 family)